MSVNPANKPTKRYVVRKYVMATSLVQALKDEKKVVAEDGWLDEKQPEQHETTAIGFELPPDEFYYSPTMKKKKKRKPQC